MSSQLTNLVPVLDGTNYQQWSTAMQSFLMSQGQWKCTKEGADAPIISTTTTEVEGGPSTSIMSGPLYPIALNVIQPLIWPD